MKLHCDEFGRFSQSGMLNNLFRLEGFKLMSVNKGKNQTLIDYQQTLRHKYFLDDQENKIIC